MLEAIEFVVGRLKGLVGHEQDADALLELNFGNFSAFFIEQKGSHFNGHLSVNRRRVVFHGLFLNDP